MTNQQTSNSFVSRVKQIKAEQGVVVAVLVDDSFTKGEADEHIKQGLGVAEIRIDLFQNTDLGHIKKEIAKFSDVPTLVTIRKKIDGGNWDKPEAERISLIRSLAQIVDAVDVELSEPESLKLLSPVLREMGCDLIASYHNFDKTPSMDHLLELIAQAKSANASAVKIACMVQDEHDCARLAALFHCEREMPLIIIAMGPIGMHSRISFPALGSLVTYSPSDKIPAAYGQISFSDMIKTLQMVYPNFTAKI